MMGYHTRRVFLRDGAATLVTLGVAPSLLARTALAAPSSRRVLVAVFQRGAVDGLNMVVPHGESAYYRSRPTIAIDRPGRPDGALDLDGFFGLHPRLAPLAPLFAEGRLAIVHACGSPDATRSHFDAQDYMETATPGVKKTQDGWLNRVLAARRAAAGSPWRGVALAQQLPRCLQGGATVLALSDLAGFGIRAGAQSDRVQASFEAEYAAAADRVLASASRDAFAAVRAVRSLDPARYQPAPGAMYPRSPFGQALRQIAQIVKADVGLEVAFAETGQWDHHVNEGGATGQLANRLDDFGHGLAAITADLRDRLDEVAILTMSEFGRAVAENGNRGTDHGHGNAMMVIGGRVRGGRVHGTWPGLEPSQRFEGRDLAVTTDFRDVFGEVVVRHLGVRHTAGVFPGYALDTRRFPGILHA